MTFKALGPLPLVYPMPALLVGTRCGEKDNFMTAAWAGAANAKPPMVTVSIRPGRHSMMGVQEHMAFSLCVPTSEMMAQTDFCGIVSGGREGANKARACGFDVFEGKTVGAPMVAQCPVCLECKVAHMLFLGTHWLVVGEVVETHVHEACLTDGKPDPTKIDPLIYMSGGTKLYASIGETVGSAFKDGLALKG